ncbi:glycoside hydrolase family 18 protein [Rubritalea tangerina]|uniref:chitinase n=1 Tax=Rubritalea tangerina TaxID=430798 RepID=A0ABW4ZCV8_9BACT
MKWILMVLGLVCLARVQAEDLIGYLPSYRVNEQALRAAGGCTDVVYFGSEMQADGSIQLPEGARKQLKQLRKVCKSKRVRMHLCIGGWGKDKHFAGVTSSEEKRSHFLGELRMLVEEFDFVGVDYDWEYPRTEAEMRGFVALCEETKKGLGKRFMVTAAFHPKHDIPKALLDALDRVHLMTYDMGGKHCAIEHSERAIQKWKGKGVDGDKICTGVAFYARKLDDRNQVKTYAQMREEFGPDVAKKMPQGGYFGDNVTSCEAKAALVKKEKIRGLIIWEIGQDAAGEDSLMLPLQRALK